jgi:hypothetical protein
VNFTRWATHDHPDDRPGRRRLHGGHATPAAAGFRPEIHPFIPLIYADLVYLNINEIGILMSQFATLRRSAWGFVIQRITADRTEILHG